ncbi:hypothetical protein [Rhodohalobacter sulfatireducens]|uniref:VCBS repeat-containing protein n=1 Tax=Rhodohalobacter sulfatireducens TaxID=2911366 RepID=A0ABS9KCA9_9BACT|nr:hypothetical protein [Rhodohalobacter sulfatireducens]MCG2588465.1 hypothetical protein [Rhodohalobacter sulfatireducens]
MSWSGIDPEEIEEKLVLFKKIHSTIDVSDKGKQLSDLITNLQEVWLLLQVCIGNIKKTGKVLHKLTGVYWPEPKVSEQLTPDWNQSIMSLYEHLLTELQKNQKRPVEQEESLQRLYKEVKGVIKRKEGNILIPVLERYVGVYQNNREYGRLRNMTIELYGESESKSKDELIWATNIYGAEKASVEKTENPINASRKLLNMFIPRSASGNYYRGAIQFENVTAIHNGNSANLAIAALWYTILLKKAGQRERYSIHSNSAITADIDKYGNIKTVDEKSIELKVKAVFFSWAKVLVVPALQRNQFELEVQKLNERFPNRNFSLIGVNHLQDIFYDRRVAIYTVQGRLSYFFNHLKNEYSKFVLVPVIIVLLLIIARMAYGPIDQNPVIIEYEGSDIVLKNSSGSTIDRVEIGEITVDLQNGTGEFQRRPLSTLLDLNGDGINELIYANRVTRQSSDQSFIRARSVSGDSLIWDQKFIANYSYPRQSAMMNFNLRPVEIGILHTNKGPKIAVNSSVIQYFQSVVFTINALNGEIEQEYVHSGRFDDMYVEDINDDNNDEIILTGINNAYWSAAIAVLEYGNAQGYAPATIDYIPSDTEPADEYRYILIPKTLIGEYFSSMLKYNRGKAVNVDELNNSFLFVVQEGRRELHGYSDDLLVLYYLDYNLKVLGIGTSDLYDIVARQLYEEGEIPEIPDFDYFQTYKDSILYWTGEEFLLAEEYFNEN